MYSCLWIGRARSGEHSQRTQRHIVVLITVADEAMQALLDVIEDGAGAVGGRGVDGFDEPFLSPLFPANVHGFGDAVGVCNHHVARVKIHLDLIKRFVKHLFGGQADGDPGRGALLNFGVYGVSLIQMLLGDPSEVSAEFINQSTYQDSFAIGATESGWHTKA